MPRALLSVYDKTGLVEFGRGLVQLGWELIASGGTAGALASAGLPVTMVETLTNAPEMLGGRVKTLHPAIHAPILARSAEADTAELAKFGYERIDLVVCNLYPFVRTVAQPGVTLGEAVEQIDIGGVTLIRAAAKNFTRVIVLCDPTDYESTLAALQAHNTTNGSSSGIEDGLRLALAVKAFAHTQEYDAAIYSFLAAQRGGPAEGLALPEQLTPRVGPPYRLRYGENPHQEGAFYPALGVSGEYLGGTLLGGNKQLSYNNLLDIDSAWRSVKLFEPPTVVIVKHLNPCGIATAATITEAFPPALASDPLSAFGGVMAVNRAVDEAFVEVLGTLFLEAIAAPEFTAGALELLMRKRKNCRLIQMNPLESEAIEYRALRGGILAQTIDQGDPSGVEWKVATKRAPTEAEYAALRFIWKACQAVKSNAIVLGVENATVGIGGGLSSRVDAAKLAVEKAGERAKGAVMASDAFFPFADGLLVGLNAGVTAVIQPGGSVRDEEAIAAADAAGVAMVFTGVRHFRH